MAAPDSAALGDATGAQAFLSAATASKAGAPAPLLPLLPQHAQQVLASVCSSAAALEQAGWGADFRLLQLAAQLVPVAYGSPAAAALSADERGELEALLRWAVQQVELHADAAGGALPGPDGCPVLRPMNACAAPAPALAEQLHSPDISDTSYTLLHLRRMTAWRMSAPPGI